MTLLLVDNQLPLALSRFLEAQGFESRHVLELGFDEATDREIWQYAQTHDCAVVSKDEDFVYLAQAESEGPQVVWVRLGNCRKAVLLEAFEKLLPVLREALSDGQRIIEIY